MLIWLIPLQKIQDPVEQITPHLWKYSFSPVQNCCPFMPLRRFSTEPWSWTGTICMPSGSDRLSIPMNDAIAASRFFFRKLREAGRSHQLGWWVVCLPEQVKPPQEAGVDPSTKMKGSFKCSFALIDFSQKFVDFCSNFEIHPISCLENWDKETKRFCFAQKDDKKQQTHESHKFFGCPLLGVRNRKKSLGKKSYQWLRHTGQLKVLQKIPGSLDLACQGFSAMGNRATGLKRRSIFSLESVCNNMQWPIPSESRILGLN